MRGRKPDPAGLQEAKGSPGKRKRGKGRAVKLTAEEIAAQLEAAQNAQAADHPKFLADPRVKEALAIWRELETDLRRLRLLDRLDRHTFAMYCVHMADWITATRDIQKRGHWKNVKNVNGDLMPRLNPMVKVREIAERHILEIGARFGLDPANRYKLLRDQAAAPMPNPDLFNRTPAGVDETQAAANSDDEPPNPLGLMDQLASAPPGSRPN